MAHTKPETIDAYIKTFPHEVQTILEKVRLTIHKTIPEATETISYGLPTFRLRGTYLVYFAGWKQHISLYPTPDGNKMLQKEIAPYKTGKGTLQFPLGKPMPYELITRIVRALAEQNARRVESP